MIKANVSFPARIWSVRGKKNHGERRTIDGDLVKDILPANYQAFYTSLDNHLLPPRTVTLSPLLRETGAHKAEQPLPLPLLTDVRHKAAWKKHGYVKNRIRGSQGSLPQHHVTSSLKQDGFRLPTSDAWEYACSAGSRTLFSWGHGRFTAENFTAISTSHNAFGLKRNLPMIPTNDTYQWDYWSNPAIMRAGDGGETVCHWAGTLAASLPLAAAYYLQLNEKEINNGVHSPCFRRTLSLPQLLK